MQIEKAEAKKVWSLFFELSKIPRSSGCEEHVIDWLKDFANKHGLIYRVDKVGNVVIEVPASVDFEQSPTVVLQGHTDMVCEKRPDSKHDFSKDAIELYEEDGWLKADGTTLGADNGIGLCTAMALAIEKDLPHPKLELLFTVDEERSLTGAMSLSDDFITGEIMINLDSEDENFFTVGCAGGELLDVKMDVQRQRHDKNTRAYEINVSNLRGGHSGTDINKQRANANKLLARILFRLKEQLTVFIASFTGGRSRNAIARDAGAVIYLCQDDLPKAKKIIDQLAELLKIEFAKADPDIDISIKELHGQCGDMVVNKKDSSRIIEFLTALPDGVERFLQNKNYDDTVETSCNLAKTQLTQQSNSLEIQLLARSFYTHKLDHIAYRVKAIAALAGAEVAVSGRYVGWMPDEGSQLLKKCVNVYQQQRGTPAKFKVFHAGVECGLIGDLYANMQMVSYGPTIIDAHSLDERVNIKSVDNVWSFLKLLMGQMK